MDTGRTRAVAEPALEAPVDKGAIERLLSPFADVRRGEAASALLLTLMMFLILAGYYLLKTAREVFILSEGGAEIKTYAAAGQAVLLLFLVPAYGAFASRVNRIQLITWISLFFASNILLFALAESAGLKVGVAYFLWLGIFNVMAIAQFWAFANDLYTQEQGKRLFPLIGVGSSLGAWLGSIRAGSLVQTAGPGRLLIGGAVILVACVGLARITNRVVGGTHAQRAAADEALGESPSGFSMILSDRYLMLIAALAVLLNVVNTSGEYLFGRYVVQHAAAMYGTGAESEAARGQFIGETYSRLYSHVNLIGLLLQMFVVGRLFKLLGVGRSLFIHPIIAAGGYLLMLRAPSFEAIGVLKTLDNAVDYSLGNTTKQALWLPTSRQAKYKAKQAVDSFCVRAGDVLTAVIVFVLTSAAVAVPVFAAFNVALTAGWLLVARGLNARLRAQAAAGRGAL
jgi:ATP:ADP antiporter, AAA family